jgi:hypothetical protein
MTRHRGSVGRVGVGLTVLVTALAGALWLGGPVGATAPDASSSHRSLDICVVLPGFEVPGDATFQIETTGPTVRGEQFQRTSTFDASACLTLRGLPPGTFTMTQIVSPPGWVLATVYCFNTGRADQPTNQFDQATSSARVEVKKTTECIFAELQGFAPPTKTRSSGGGGGQGTTSTTKPGTTSTTAATTTTTAPAGGGGRIDICTRFPGLCIKLPPLEPRP